LETVLTIGVMYVLLYVLVLDPIGAHMYVILSPRTYFFPIVCILVLGLLMVFYTALGGSYVWLVKIFKFTWNYAIFKNFDIIKIKDKS